MPRARLSGLLSGPVPPTPGGSPMARPMKRPEPELVHPDEVAVAELLAAIGEARDRAKTADEFSDGCAYAHASLMACNKVARLAGVSPSKKGYS
jgi:hypothetical protein